MSTGNSCRYLGRFWPWGTAFWQEGYAVRAQIGREQARSELGPSRKRRCAGALRHCGLAASGCVSVGETDKNFATLPMHERKRLIVRFVKTSPERLTEIRQQIEAAKARGAPVDLKGLLEG